MFLKSLDVEHIDCPILLYFFCWLWFRWDWVTMMSSLVWIMEIDHLHGEREREKSRESIWLSSSGHMGYLVLTRDLYIISSLVPPLLKLPDLSTWGGKTKRHTYGKIPKPYISHNIYICLHIMWSFVLGKKYVKRWMLNATIYMSQSFSCTVETTKIHVLTLKVLSLPNFL